MQETLNLIENFNEKRFNNFGNAYALTEASEIVDLALSVDLPKSLKFIIKMHPTISNEKFRELVPKSVNDKFEFTNKL